MSNPTIDALDVLVGMGITESTDAPDREIYGDHGTLARHVDFSHWYRHGGRDGLLATVRDAESWRDVREAERESRKAEQEPSPHQGPKSWEGAANRRNLPPGGARPPGDGSEVSILEPAVSSSSNGNEMTALLRAAGGRPPGQLVEGSKYSEAGSGRSQRTQAPD